MNEPRRTNRRDFLQGKSAAEHLRQAIESLLPEGDALPPAKSPRFLLHIERRAMACQFTVFLNAGQPPHGVAAATAALDVIDAVEDQLTVYRDTSDVAEINRDAYARPVILERGLFDLIERAMAIHRDTQGAFDLTSGPLSKIWGFYRRQGAIPAAEDLAAALARVGSQWIELDRAAQTIRCLKPGVELNFGAIGKGFALDRAADRLREEGVEHFLLHGGQSSILAAGHRLDQTTGQGWRVALQHPLRRHQALGHIQLLDRAIGTSGSGVQFFRHSGKRYGHILDPRTGWPAEELLSVTVAAPTAETADALSTACYVWGHDASLDYAAKHPEIGLLLIRRRLEGSGIEIVERGFRPDELVLYDRG